MAGEDILSKTMNDYIEQMTQMNLQTTILQPELSPKYTPDYNKILDLLYTPKDPSKSLLGIDENYKTYFERDFLEKNPKYADTYIHMDMNNELSDTIESLKMLKPRTSDIDEIKVNLNHYFFQDAEPIEDIPGKPSAPLKSGVPKSMRPIDPERRT